MSNQEQYNKYGRYRDYMRVIGVTEVTTTRQNNNGTRVYRLPFKDAYGYDIEFATYKSGYVRKLMKYGYCPCYQINQVRKVSGKFHEIKYGQHKGYYTKYDTSERVLIPEHGDRIEYLLKFILRNYFVAKPKFQPQLNMDSLNRMAKYVFGEFGFDSCDSDTQDRILKRIQE